jgi:lipopolysaccharide transport system ATP-binding protein
LSLVTAEQLAVDFAIYGTKSRSLKNTVLRAATGGVLAADAADRVVVRALDHLNFEFKEGERVGLTGHNGSGKTTLLRVLAGIYEPTSGAITVNGRVASMLSITLGMDSDATGYENIFIRGTLLGLRKKEIAELADEVCEFSELGDYIHMPMRTYSSGMVMRLMFAISTSTNADIILMDEWLSAGDREFTGKAEKRLRQLVDRAKLLVIASHNPEVIQHTCNRVIHLEHGKIVDDRATNIELEKSL